LGNYGGGCSPFGYGERVTIVAACDGSSFRNPNGPGGWAWVVNDKCWQTGGGSPMSNNQAELLGLLNLLQAAPPGVPLKVYLDSQYVKNCVTVWVHGWKRNGWRTKSGDPVKNELLIRGITDLMVGRAVELVWVRGHSGHELNESADVKARAAAVASEEGANVTLGPGWVVSGIPETSLNGLRPAGGWVQQRLYVTVP
jgi:ribonuclease HI